MVNLTTRPKLTLTSDNYYGNDADLEYMSATWIKKFMECEAAGLNSLLNPPQDAVPTVPMLEGNFVHSYFESVEAHQAFIDEHQPSKGSKVPTIFTQKGKLLAKFKEAQRMIDRLKQSNEFNFFYNGPDCQKEAIVTGQLYGVNWKGKIDSLNVDKGYFCDLKTTADMHRSFWNAEKHERQSWFDEYNYALQMGAYKKLLQSKYHKPFNVYVFAVDKKDSPAVEALEVDYSRLQAGLDQIEEYQPRLMQVISGEEEPVRCGNCDYCRSTYQPFGFKGIDDLVEIS